MKRKICVVLLLMLCIQFLLGFGFTEVYKVEKAIKSVGFVTLESREEIETAEKMYAALSAKNRHKVDNYEVLLQARTELDRLQNLVDTAQYAIDNIKMPITADSGDSLVDAQRAYNAAREAGVHSYIDRYENLYLSIEPYAAIAIAEADKLMQQHRYVDAYVLYARVFDNFPSCIYAAEARNGCEASLVGSAEEMYNRGQLEDALDSLDDIDVYYGVSQKSTQLRETILKRLNQSRPKSGQTFSNTIGWGYGQFVVTAGNDDACVILEDVSQPSKSMLFYVRAGETTTVQVKDGFYTAAYMTGPYWFGKDSRFGGYTKDSGDVSGTLEFSTTRQNSRIYYSVIEINLGNSHTNDPTAPQSETPTGNNLTDYIPVDAPVKSAVASSTYTGDKATHVVTNLLDNNRKTNWTEGVTGDGIGEYIQFDFWGAYYLKAVFLYAGNQYDNSRYLNNGRPEKITLTFADGSSVSATLKDVMEGQAVVLSTPVITDSVRITIDSVYQGNKYTDTVISDVSFEAYVPSLG